MKKIVLSIIAVFLFLSGRAQEDRGYLVAVGDMAPDVNLILEDGTTTKLSDLRGKVLLLQFTATWCPVCLKETPHIEKDIWNEFSSNDEFALYGVMLKNKQSDVAKLRALTGATYPMAIDTDGNVFYSFAKKDAGVTRNILIDRDGKIVFLTRLFDEKEFQELTDAVKTEMNRR